jgi:RIO kinase 1
MLSIGLIHGDLSEFNVLAAADGPVIIDLPQRVNAAGNNQAFAMLQRDVNNLRGTLGRFSPELLEAESRGVWALFEARHHKPESKLTGVFARKEGVTDTTNIEVIEDAREENIRRELVRRN